MAMAAAVTTVPAPCALRSCSTSSAAAAAGFVSFAGLRRTGTSPRGVATVVMRARGVTASRAAATVAAPKFTTFRPLGDRVLVALTTKEEKTSGGILLPSSAQSKPQSGEVVEVGEGRPLPGGGDKKAELGVAKGDSVIYSKFAGTEVEFNGVTYMLLKEEDIVGCLEAGGDIGELKPLADRVLIRIQEAEGKSAGGVLLTDSAKEKPVVGEIVAAGPGGIAEDGARKPLELAPGNTVLYSKYAGNEFKGKDGSTFVVLRAADVLAVLQ